MIKKIKSVFPQTTLEAIQDGRLIPMKYRSKMPTIYNVFAQPDRLGKYITVLFAC